ncbi:hypothetical protein C8Q77DRAFT_295998 [Trametes polyzona]|nr:hypothetical protein C8Q77DRAFT_295998 [Trametes polyzona]
MRDSLSGPSDWRATSRHTIVESASPPPLRCIPFDPVPVSWLKPQLRNLCLVPPVGVPDASPRYRPRPGEESPFHPQHQIQVGKIWCVRN